ncbi:hypothetical protein ScPMuIL_004855 [Solemya velum]
MATLNTKHTKRKYNGNRTHSDNITRKYRKRKKTFTQYGNPILINTHSPCERASGTPYARRKRLWTRSTPHMVSTYQDLDRRETALLELKRDAKSKKIDTDIYQQRLDFYNDLLREREQIPNSMLLYLWKHCLRVLLVRTGADELPQSDIISAYTILTEKIAVLGNTCERELMKLRKKMKKQQEEIETLQITQEQFRSDFEECLNVEKKDQMTIASHDKNLVMLKSVFRSMRRNIRGLQASVYHQKILLKSNSREINVTLSRLSEHEQHCTISPEVVVVNGNTGPALNVTSGFYLRNSGFHVTRTANVDICAKECLLHNLCHSLNYDTTSKLCTLNAVSQSCTRLQDLEEKNTSVYLEVQDIPMDYARNCQNHDCAYGDRCEASQTIGYACARQGLELDFIKHYPGEQKHASCYVTGRGRVVRLDCSEYNMNEQSFDHCPSIRLGSDSSSLCDPSIGTSCSSSDCLYPDSPYMGHRTCTLSGYTCQRWDVFQPHSHNYNVSDRFPDAYISAANNYCRDPSNTGMPWCYTTDPGVRWQFCDIPVCPWATKSCCGVPETHRHNLSSLDLICETETAVCDGTNMYVGNFSYTINGDQCRRWDVDLPHVSDLWDPALFPDVDVHAANNYCRNVGENYTWCYTMNPRVKWDYCATPC